jgi:hypothetical protein
VVFSIGHSNHDLTRLVALLRRAGVVTVADVRSLPVSQRYPQYNRGDFERALGECGIGYVWLGEGLGGRPRQPELYDAEGRADYEKMRRTEAFRRGLGRLLEEARRGPVAMLCSEEDPLDCHRGLMITPALMERGVAPVHLRGDGGSDSTAEIEERLLAWAGLDGIVGGLFGTTLRDEERREALADAYRRQAKRKAFQLPPDKRALLHVWKESFGEGSEFEG